MTEVTAVPSKNAVRVARLVQHLRSNGQGDAESVRSAAVALGVSEAAVTAAVFAVAPPTFAQVEAALSWERVEWKYLVTAPGGDRWHLVQSTSKKWSIYRNGREDGDAVTLRDAKFWVADTIFEELRPDVHAQREARRAERRARRQARL